MAMFSIITIFLLTITTVTGNNLYLSPKTTFSNYNTMLSTFKIFTYSATTTTTTTTLFTTPQESQFHNTLLTSHFTTQDPNHAHLFFLPFPPSTSMRSLARLIKTIRTTFPFWNRTLGADHFYLSAAGVDSSSDRNVVELKKNSVQISCFPTASGMFVPHKDVTLPPVHSFQGVSSVNHTDTPSYLGYMRLTDESHPTLIKEIKNHPDFKVELDSTNKKKKFVKSSRFCLFVYGSDMTWMVEALASGCVPVVITDRPIQDLPLMDVINWSEIAVFVGPTGGAEGLKRVLDGIEKSRYERMVEYGVAATQHLVWNEKPQAHDAFHMVVYQLWLRRHTIRYARWVEQ
ncbi:putative glycosyltransferase At3g07620 [Bidens hawaiensis]|uniref:putative glycosyltransferase At3g07620 n=1 Tax=Bidens hawaiensis TaxID=980011 RepID=UPI0040496BB2